MIVWAWFSHCQRGNSSIPELPVRFPFRLGMRFVVFGAEVFQANVGVFLGRCQTRMAKEFLDRTEIGAALEQVSGETVPQRVGG